MMQSIYSRMVPLIAVAFFILPATLGAWEWTSTDGRKLQAVFEKLEGDVITLKLRNGKKIKFTLDKLVKSDHAVAKRFAAVGDATLTLQSAKKIDNLLARQLGKSGVRSFNERLPDDLFVRRVYLDIIGRIPTRKEFMDFAEDARDDKRTILIDKLLANSGRSSHLFNYFADMYRLKGSGVARELDYTPYIHWWRKALANNEPYDEMVRHMITATGNLGHDPAVGFLQRDEGMEFDAFSNFGQVMMGIDVSCAQCHDHPFEEWTMNDFYQMAAFFGQTQRSVGRYAGAGMMKNVRVGIPGAPDGWKDDFTKFAVKNGLDMDNRRESRAFGYYLGALGLNVTDNEAIEIRIPSTIEEVGGQVLEPLTLYGENTENKSETSRREELAAWLTGPENERFAVNIANRMWERAFGKALVEPVIDFPMDWEKHTGQPEVLKFLGSEMMRIGYDLREFMRILYNTDAYQGYSTHKTPISSLKKYQFQGPVLRRMRAEQAWDSLLTLAYGSDIDDIYGSDGSFMREVLKVDFENDSMEEIFAKFEAYRGNRNLGNKMISEPGELNPREPEVPVVSGIKMIRASRIEQPASGTSLLSAFGQSDRMVTDNHVFDGTVPQVLALMNGPVTDRLTGSTSKIVQDLEQFDGEDDKVRGVFFTMLSRFPTDKELKQGMAILDKYGDDGLRDLAWALLNTPEFLFIQ